MAESHARGGPTLDWSIIQPKFGDVEAEVLLLLDCCFAAQAARASLKHAISSNMELFAACAMGVKTKLPGPHSFTAHLIGQLKTALKEHGYAKISEIANFLAHRDSGYRQTPVHFTGLSDGKSTICLEPFDQSLVDEGYKKRESAWLTLKISLRDVISETLVTELIQWLKAHPARKVSRLTVEDIVLSTNTMHRFIHDEDRATDSGPRYSQLDAVDRQEVALAWSRLKALLVGLATQLGSFTITGTEDMDNEFNRVAVPAASQRVPHALLALEDGMLSLGAAIRQSVISVPSLYSDYEAMQKALEAVTTKELGLEPFLSRRLKAHFPSRTIQSLKTSHPPNLVPEKPKGFGNLFEDNLPGFGSVLVEHKCYVKNAIQKGDMQRLEERIQTLADLLRTPVPAGFHTMRCLRWFHDPENARFGLIFEPPKDYTNFISLRDLITLGSTHQPTLGQRFSIITSVGEALLSWHNSANWVHQGVASHNIYFFKFANFADYDYSNPFLCGFEFARPSSGVSQSVYVEDFEQNVYRHPARQGAPIEYHIKQHDLYAFGILMLEVGAWVLVGRLFDAKLREYISPQKMQDHIKLEARRKLGRRMGTVYREATRRCLDTDFGVTVDDPVGSNLAKAFEKLILKEIESGTKLG